MRKIDEKAVRENRFELMYIAGMLSDCQELLGPDLNGEENEGWVGPINVNQAIAIMNNAKKLLFKKMEEI